jgi:U4/U6.U5 tri-snRNP component SNU23
VTDRFQIGSFNNTNKTMSSNLNYKQVANVSRRTWDVETYQQRAASRKEHEKTPKTTSASAKGDGIHQVAAADAAGPTGSRRAFLQARQSAVVRDIDERVGTTQIVSVESAAATATTDVSTDHAPGISQKGVGWYCRLCDCYLKDSLTYLDHLNGRKHQRALGYTMRVERSTTEDVMAKLQQLEEKQKEQEQIKIKEQQQLVSKIEGKSGKKSSQGARNMFAISAADEDDNEDDAIQFQAREEEIKRRKEAKKLKKKVRKESKMNKESPLPALDEESRNKEAGHEQSNQSGTGSDANVDHANQHAVADPSTESQQKHTSEDASPEDQGEHGEDEIDPALASLMGFSGFGTTKR